MAVFLAIFDVRLAMIAKIAPGSLHTIVEAAPLNLIEFPWNLLPGFLPISDRLNGCSRSLGHTPSRSSQS